MNRFSYREKGYKRRVAPLAALISSFIGMSACGSLVPEADEAHRTTEKVKKASEEIFYLVSGTDFEGSPCYVGGNDNYVVVITPQTSEKDIHETLKVEKNDSRSSVSTERSDDPVRFKTYLGYERETDSTLVLSDALQTMIGTRDDSIDTKGRATVDEIIDQTQHQVRQILSEC